MKNVIANTIPIHRHSLCVYFSILSLIAATLSKLVPRCPSSGKEFREVATVTQVVWNLFEDILHLRTRLQVPIREYTIAARYAEALLPQKSQFFLPGANGWHVGTIIGMEKNA